jgi:hypothetical protein
MASEVKTFLSGRNPIDGIPFLSTMIIVESIVSPRFGGFWSSWPEVSPPALSARSEKTVKKIVEMG